MPRRKKQWWAALDEWERDWLVRAERDQKKFSSYGAGGYLPDDCSECTVCGEPQLGSGMCRYCGNLMTTIIAKADEATQRTSP